MFGGLFGNSKKVSVGKGALVGDIVVNLPDFTGPNVPPLYWPLRGIKKIVMAVPIPITCLELKKRILGKTKIHLSSIVLFYMGSIVHGDEELTREMYEQELTEDSDDDIFRPRLFLGIVDEPEEEIEEEVYSSESESESDSSIGEMKDFNAEMEVIEEEKEDEVVLAGVPGDDDSSAPGWQFDLKTNLEKIGCGRFHDALVAEGFVDEGSFANLTDDILKSPPLFMPLVFRQRITALGDIVKRRLETNKQVVAETETGKLSEEMIQQGTIKTKTVEGLSGTYTTKIAMKRAWEQKVKDDAQAEKDLAMATAAAAAAAAAAAEKERLKQEEVLLSQEEDERPTKQLPAGVRDMIQAARERLQRDEFECLSDPATLTASTFCCEAHQRECSAARDGLQDMRRLLIQADLQVAADRVDYHQTTFVCRYQLKLIARQFLARHDVTLSEGALEALLDGCVMTAEDQVRLREWAEPAKRANPLFDIPLSGYSTNKFALLVSTEINSIQQKKILVVDE